jgi:hypothetical protein
VPVPGRRGAALGVSPVRAVPVGEVASIVPYLTVRWNTGGH